MMVSTVLLAALHREVEETGLSRSANEGLSKVGELVDRLEDETHVHIDTVQTTVES